MMSKKGGITAIELLVGIAILVLVGAIAFGVFTNFRANSELTSAHSSVMGMLQEARSKTLDSAGRQEHGVHFEETKAVLFAGTVYSVSDPDNKEYVLPSLTRVSSINLTGGAVDVYFARLTGFASVTGTIVIEVKGNPANDKTITINPSGLSE